ncbi:hypothetical protein GW755_03375 [bacterium]|nr:hypothetical protein [bacterium]
MSVKYLEIVPGLVSLETHLPLVDFLLLTKNITPRVVDRKYRFHYTVAKYSKYRESLYRKALKRGNYSIDGDYTSTNNSVYYRRPLYKGVGFVFEYDYKNRIFYFNPLYRFLRVNLGDIFTLGRHLFHVIQIDLLKAGFLVTFSASFKINGSVYLILAKGRNGKTSLVTSVLKSGGEYISENFTIWDTKTDTLYGTYPVFVNKGRGSNRDLRDVFSKRGIDTCLKKSKVDAVIYLSRGLESKSSSEVLHEYFYGRNLGFLKNNFALSYIYASYSFRDLYHQADRAFELLGNYRITYIQGYDQKKLLNFLLKNDK